MYRDTRILDVKHYVHEKYSSEHIDLWGSVAAEVANLVSNPRKILDIGCGTGEMCAKYGYLFRNSEVYGLDIALGGMSSAKDNNPEATYMLGDIKQIPFTSGTFDVISALHTLPYVPSIYESFKEVRRVLTKSGVFVSTANSINSYPHVAKYRRDIAQMLGWREPIFPTTSYNLENMSKFAVGTTLMLPGELGE